MSSSQNIPQLPINNIDIIRKLVPHREPVLAIDSLLKCSNTNLQASFTITKDHLFTCKGYFSEAGLIEHMAQCIALHTGYLGALEANAPQEGYIGTIKAAEIFSMPKIGDTMVTQIEILHSVMGMSMVTAAIHVNGKLCAEASMNTILKNKEV